MSSPGRGGDQTDDERSVELHCLRRGWRRRRLGDEVFLFDEKTGYLARVDRMVASRLREADAGSSLREALAAVAGGAPVDDGGSRPGRSGGAQHVVSLQLLGVRLDVRCRNRRCSEEIRSYFSASGAEPGSASPEVVVWCAWEAAGRYLYRSRPEELEGVPLDGVSVQTLRSGRQRWTSALPPVPALASWPFKDRFLALHAAAIRTSGGDGVVLVGHRGSGKSTTALALVKVLPGSELLCDETAFIHSRTALVEPFPHAVGVWRDGGKVQVPIVELCAGLPVGRSRRGAWSSWSAGTPGRTRSSGCRSPERSAGCSRTTGTPELPSGTAHRRCSTSRTGWTPGSSAAPIPRGRLSWSVHSASNPTRWPVPAQRATVGTLVGVWTARPARWRR